MKTKPEKLAHTYSIVARDPDTGEMGVAVQSHWFSVGSLVPWAEAGVGAVATQSFVNGPERLQGVAEVAGAVAPVRSTGAAKFAMLLSLIHLVSASLKRGAHAHLITS